MAVSLTLLKFAFRAIKGFPAQARERTDYLRTLVRIMLTKFEHEVQPRADVIRLAMAKLDPRAFDPPSLALKRAQFGRCLTRAVPPVELPGAQQMALQEYREALALSRDRPTKQARVHLRLASFELEQLDRDPKAVCCVQCGLLVLCADLRFTQLGADALARDATENILAAVALGLRDARVLMARLPGLAASFPHGAGTVFAEKASSLATCWFRVD
jgi:hypothetical protein